MLVLFAVAVTVPPQLLLTPGVPATCNPLVNVSPKAIPLSAVVFAPGFVRVKVSVVVSFKAILAAPNALLIVGGATTFKVAVLLVVPVPASAEVIGPVVLSAFPAAVPCTSTVKVHEVFWATLPPDKLMRFVPAVAVTVPPQVLFTLGGLATSRVPVLDGSVSLKTMPVRLVEVLELLMVKVAVAEPFNGMLAALNAF